MKVVINFDYPQSSEDYIHRIGRTGRLQKSGTSYAFFTPSNMHHAPALISVLKETNQPVSPQLMEMAEIAKSNMMSKKSKSSKGGPKGIGPQRGSKINGRGMSRGGLSRGAMSRGSCLKDVMPKNSSRGSMSRGMSSRGGLSRGMSRGGSRNLPPKNSNHKFDQKPNYQGNGGQNKFGFQRDGQNKSANQRNGQNGQGFYQRNNDYGNQGYQKGGYDYHGSSQGFGQGPPAGQFNIPPPGYNLNGNQCVQYPIAY